MSAKTLKRAYGFNGKMSRAANTLYYTSKYYTTNIIIISARKFNCLIQLSKKYLPIMHYILQNWMMIERPL